MSKDWLWIVKNFENLVTKYGGRYIAVINEKVIAEGSSRKEVKEIAKEKELKAPFIMLIPDEESLRCLL